MVGVGWIGPSMHSISCAKGLLLFCPSTWKPLKDAAHLSGAKRTAARSTSVRYLLPMIDKRFFDDLNERIGEAFRNSPAQDIEKNLKALLA